MDIVLYNPLSRNGKNHHVVKKLEKLLKKQKRSYQTKNLLEIEDVDLFLKHCNPEDRLIIVGGDGTLKSGLSIDVRFNS